ncbi:fungal hydrophobin-domain-containing protein [Daedaleopsis nitida]|nr:fungal hydrophobin-domain-containing protein [Daedaleopsis nitida]
MFSKLFAVSAVALLAAATPALGADCATGPIQCCQSVEPASSEAVAPILKSIGVVVQDVNALVGLTCSAVSVVGVGSGGACDAQTVCCENNSFGGLISIGCLPVSA